MVYMTIGAGRDSDSGHRPSNVVELLRWRAAHQPERVAYTFLLDGEIEEARLTYKELDQRAQAIGARLQSSLAAGARVVLLYPPGLEYICAFFGCLYAGVVAVPAYPPRANRNLSRLQSVVTDSGAALALTTTKLYSNIERGFAHDTSLKRLRWITTDDLAQDSANEWREITFDSSALAFIQYTSGSTAAPRGVMVGHGNLFHNLGLIHRCFENTSESRGMIWLPPYHDMGLIGGVLQPLYGGHPVTLMSPFAFLQRPLRWLQVISRTRATHSGAPNFAYDLCLRKVTDEQLQALDLSCWEVAFNGAEPIRHEVMERFAATFGRCGFRREAFYPCYGLAEATLIVSGGEKRIAPVVGSFQQAALEQHRVIADLAEDENFHTVVGCGRALDGQRIIIADPVLLTRCPPDGVGEIWVSGPSVARGYWNRPQETERVFGAYLSDTGEGPFLRTGDLGFLNDGELFVTGRLKELIIMEGRNHYPQDIELTAAGSHPSLQAGGGAAFTVAMEGKERLVLVHEVGHRQQLKVEGAIGAVRQAVAEEHSVKLSAVVIVGPGTIPRTSSGKIQRSSCRNNFLTGSLDVIVEWLGHVRPRAYSTSASDDKSISELCSATGNASP